MKANSTWLNDTITTKRKEAGDRDKYNPFTVTLPNGTVEIDIDLAKDDQLTVLVPIMTKLREWVTCATIDDDTVAKTFQSMRLTICGSAGSGKSFFIECLANTIRRIFQMRTAVVIAAPTGAAAYNVGGETVHRTFAVNPHKPSQRIGKSATKRLKNDLIRTLVLIIDERSMLTTDVIGAAERNSAATVHGGYHDSEDWGGIPIVIFVGDDFQLPPPTNREKGAFDTMDSNSSWSQQQFNGNGAFGHQIFKAMSETCMELTTVKRQNSSQSHYKEVLQ